MTPPEGTCLIPFLLSSSSVTQIAVQTLCASQPSFATPKPKPVLTFCFAVSVETPYRQCQLQCQADAQQRLSSPPVFSDGPRFAAAGVLEAALHPSIACFFPPRLQTWVSEPICDLAEPISSTLSRDIGTRQMPESCDLFTLSPNLHQEAFHQPAQMSGFSVYQPELGAQLQWLPALGTPELDEMIHALIPGTASIQEKRAAVSVNFFAFAEQTGQKFKYYPVSVSPAPAAVPSPASSAGFYDSAYSSSFNASPVISNMSPWPQSPATFVSSFDEPKPAPHTSKRTSTSSSKQTAVDFANHPGMRILTKDGRDVTNSASRGCKTKEQRNHAHLMRIIKACDACKRKKVRCDPSHRKRTASSSSTSQSELKATKKIKKKAAESPPAPPIIMPDLSTSTFTFDIPEAFSSSSSFESSPETIDDLWTQFVAFDQEPMALVNNFTFDDYSFFNDPQSLSTPGSIDSSSSSPSQWLTGPYTPAPPGPSPPVIISESPSSELVSPAVLSADVQQDDLIVPYLNPGVPHGTNYADFRLFSPPRDFFLDEEPLPAKKAMMSGRNQRQSPQTSALSTVSPAELSASPNSGAFASSDGYYSSPYTTSSTGGSPSASGRLDEPRHSSTTLVYTPLGDGVRATAYANVNGIPGHGTQGQRQHRAAHHTSRLGTPVSSLSTSEPRAPQSQAKSAAPTSSQQPPSSRTHSSSAHDGSPSGYEAANQARRSHAPCQLHAPSRLEAIRLCSTDPSPTSVAAAQSSVAGVTLPMTIQSKVEAPPVLSERPGASVYSMGLGAQPVAVLAAALVATLPTQRLLGGECMKNGRISSGILFQFAVFGLVSSLLAVALQAQSLGSVADWSVIVNLIIIASMSFASVLYRCWRLPEASSPEPVDMPTTIDNVKTKVQDVGRQVDGLSCAVSRHMRTLVPRLPSLSTVKF